MASAVKGANASAAVSDSCCGVRTGLRGMIGEQIYYLLCRGDFPLYLSVGLVIEGVTNGKKNKKICEGRNCSISDQIDFENFGFFTYVPRKGTSKK